MTHKTTPLIAATAFGLALLLSACGTSGSPNPASTPTTTHTTAPTGGSGASRALQYSRCMRAHGVPNFPDPVDGHIMLTPASGIDPNSPTFEAAAGACAKYGPSGGASPSSTNGASPSASGATASTVTPASWSEFATWLKSQATADRFAGSVLVAHDGKTVLNAGYGRADRTANTPDSPATLFCIASIGKLFTAIAIGQLAEQHKLSFDAHIGDYLSGLPAAIADHVTIGELLDMTAGLGDTVLGRANPPSTLAGMVSLIAKERPAFKPGAKFSYSNDDYILLGAAIQRLSGESYEMYLRQHILDPAGMTHTDYSTYVPQHVPGMAHGYALVGSKLRDISAAPQIANPSGGAYSTTGDLRNFAQALLDHTLLSAAMTATILAPRVDSPQPGGPPVDKYTYGFAYQQVNGVTFVGHNGGTPGYTGQIDIYPGTGYVVVILTNQDGALVPAIQRSESVLTDS
jgi:CubicO group peptidase (beta-lactamase class C family)